jgi:hypothetical protein
MQYAVLIYNDEKVTSALDDQARLEMGQRHARFMKLLRERNALVGGEQLQPVSTATTLRRDGDRVMVTDGPYTEAAEQLAGFYLIEAADLDEAIGWTKPITDLLVEIRPIVAMPPARALADQ